MDALTASPFEDKLRTCVEAAYDAFGRGQVSRTLEVCQCPVCMTDETRAEITATSNDALSVALIAEYSNSAHGVPQALEDLRLLLPRYLDLMAQDEMVDHIGVGTELHRFGQAQAQHPDLFSASERAVLDDWARAMMWQFAWADTQEEGALHTPGGLFETLLCGGWSVPVVTGALEDVFADPALGTPSLRVFAGMVLHRAIKRHGRLAPDWFALRYCSEAVRQEVAAWLNALAGSDQVLDLASDPEGQDDWGYVQALAWSAGQFDAALFPGGD